MSHNPISPKVPRATDASAHKPGGGDVKIFSQRKDYSNVQSKVPKAADAAKHKAAGGNVEIFHQKLDFNAVSPRIDASVPKTVLSPKSGPMSPKGTSPRPAISHKLEWKAEAKVPKAADAAKHKAGGGEVQITSTRLDWKAEAKIPKAAEAALHKPGGGDVQITSTRLDWKAEAKIPKAAEAALHKPGGGNVEIFDEKPTFAQNASSKIMSPPRSPRA